MARRLEKLAKWLFFVGLILAWLSAPSSAQEYKLEALAEAPPADALAKPIVDALQVTGYRLTRGADQVVCDLWFCKTWELDADFKPNPTVLYPFRAGELIGALRFPRSGDDFRDQQIRTGVYTLRYLQQPVDGNHVGTSPTLDFLLMIRTSDDKTVAPIETMRLIELSAEASGSGHPAILCLQDPGTKPEKTPELTHNDDKDWWLGTFIGQGKAGDMTKETVVKLILIGAGID